MVVVSSYMENVISSIPVWIVQARGQKEVIDYVPQCNNGFLLNLVYLQNISILRLHDHKRRKAGFRFEITSQKRVL